MTHPLIENRPESDHQFFLDRLVHDLREPLRSVEVYSELLGQTTDGGLEPEGRQFLAEILHGTARMRHLIDAVSGYAIALIGHSQESRASVELALRLAIANLSDQIQACDAHVDAAQSLPTVRMSPERLVQLLQLLLENSLKFRGTAPVRINVSAELNGANQWIVKVEDNGIGIDPTDMAIVFRPFERLNGRRYSGSGLGLTACSKIVEGHGGRIWVDPQHRNGSCLCFTVPGD